MQYFHEYVNRKQDDLVKFCEDRKKGASKIATEARAKGGAAQLTAWHFAAKLPEYDECIKAIKNGKSAEYFKQKMLKHMRNASTVGNQKKFQELLGKAEVYGEIYQVIKL